MLQILVCDSLHIDILVLLDSHVGTLDGTVDPVKVKVVQLELHEAFDDPDEVVIGLGFVAARGD